jgi:hypothetical protein
MMSKINRTPIQSLGNSSRQNTADQSSPSPNNQVVIEHHQDYTMQILDVWRIHRQQMIKPILHKY